MNRKLLFSVITAIVISGGVVSALDVPPLDGRVNDRANMISANTEQEINQYLTALEEQTGAQLAVLTIPSLEGESLEGYSIQVVDEWQLGTANEDNGALLLVAAQEKQIRIEVGYGLEGELTDAKSGYVIRNAIQPSFQRGNFDQGFLAGVQTIGGVIAGDIEIAPASVSQSSRSADRAPVGFSFNLIAFFLVFALGGLGRFGRRGRFGRALFWGMLLGGNRHRGGFGGGSSFGGGGFGSGGFGGFSGGGGGFGGGGASGGW